jgi:disulfide bond formation protein DsbB
MNNVFSARALFAGAVALVLIAIGSALYLQYKVGIAPCPLCVIQRMGFIAAAILAAAAAIVGRGTVARIVLGAVAVLASLAGAGVSAWHVWLLKHPPETLGCGRPFEWFSEDFPLVVWLPKLFRGDGDCLAVDWTFFGLAVPHLAGLTYIALTVLLVWGTRAALKERASGGRRR